MRPRQRRDGGERLFFFQAEDGIRGLTVTGVQTCALPISTIVFLTVNTRKRIPWLAQPPIHAILRQTWLEADAWLAGTYVLMPDHVHLFCAPRDLNLTLDTWVTYWKSQFKKNLNAFLSDPGRVRPNREAVRPVCSSGLPPISKYSAISGGPTAAENKEKSTVRREARTASGTNRFAAWPHPPEANSLPPLIGNPSDFRW